MELQIIQDYSKKMIKIIEDFSSLFEISYRNNGDMMDQVVSRTKKPETASKYQLLTYDDVYPPRTRNHKF